MINSGLIGCGNWGKKIKIILKKNTNLHFVSNSKSDYKKKIDKVDWVFVATPDKTHFRIVKFLINKNKNVFCEKPLTPKISEAELLFSLAKKKGTKLYVSDIENFKKKILYKKNNLIIRESNFRLNYKNILNRWFYHDFYSIFFNKNITNLRVESIKLNQKLNFILKLNNKKYHFIYNEFSKNKKYLHNNTDLYKSKRDKLEVMIKKVLENKVDYTFNKEVALQTIYGVNLIKNIIYKNYNITNNFL
jgi:hypothetical protein